MHACVGSTRGQVEIECCILPSLTPSNPWKWHANQPLRGKGDIHVGIERFKATSHRAKVEAGYILSKLMPSTMVNVGLCLNGVFRPAVSGRSIVGGIAAINGRIMFFSVWYCKGPYLFKSMQLGTLKGGCPWRKFDHKDIVPIWIPLSCTLRHLGMNGPLTAHRRRCKGHDWIC